MDGSVQRSSSFTGTVYCISHCTFTPGSCWDHVHSLSVLAKPTITLTIPHAVSGYVGVCITEDPKPLLSRSNWTCYTSSLDSQGSPLSLEVSSLTPDPGCPASLDGTRYFDFGTMTCWPDRLHTHTHIHIVFTPHHTEWPLTICDDSKVYSKVTLLHFVGLGSGSWDHFGSRLETPQAINLSELRSCCFYLHLFFAKIIEHVD